jgi:hypothetical protein
MVDLFDEEELLSGFVSGAGLNFGWMVEEAFLSILAAGGAGAGAEEEAVSGRVVAPWAGWESGFWMVSLKWSLSESKVVDEPLLRNGLMIVLKGSLRSTAGVFWFGEPGGEEKKEEGILLYLLTADC